MQQTNLPTAEEARIELKRRESMRMPTPEEARAELNRRGQSDKFNTKLEPKEEVNFNRWKKQYAPEDSGMDYDLRGAYKAGLKPDSKTGHWPDTYKKPNHPTFSDQSIYAKMAPEKAGRWEGEKYIPPSSKNVSREAPMSGFESALTGFNTGVENFTHGVGQPLYESGLLGQDTKERSQRIAQERKNEFQNALSSHPAIANIAGMAGGLVGTAPLMGIPGVGKNALLRALMQGIFQGGAMGAGQYVEGNGAGERGINALIGAGMGAVSYPVAKGLSSVNPKIKAGTGAALAGTGAYSAGVEDPYKLGEISAIGAAVPFAPRVAGNALKNLYGKTKNALTGAPYQAAKSPLEDAVARDMLSGIDPEVARERISAGRRLGVHVRPSEIGYPTAGAAEGNVGKTEKGSKDFYEYGKGRLLDEKTSISSLLNMISKDASPAAKQVKTAAESYISEKEEALSKKAAPFYEKAFSQEVSRNQLNAFTKDPIVNSAYGKVMSDPVWQKELEGYSPNSIKALDLIKREIGNKIEFAMKNEPSKVPTLVKSQKALLTKIDNHSPDYQKARQIFSEGAKPLEELRASELARKIANLDDISVKNISKNIFDPQQTDPKILATLRDQISSKDKKAWPKLVRNELERVMDKKENNGIPFFKQNLLSDRRFKQLLVATEKMPGVNQKLKDMRLVFKDLINPPTARTAAGLAKTKMTQSRSSLQGYIDKIQELMGGQYDKAAIKLITSPTWDKELTRIAEMNNKEERALRFTNLLAKIATSLGTQKIAERNQ